MTRRSSSLCPASTWSAPSKNLPNLERTVEELARGSFPEPARDLAAERNAQVYAVDGSAYFNRPGPRIVDGLEILAEIIQPDLFRRQKPPLAWRRVRLFPPV